MRIGDSYFLEDLKGEVGLTLKDPLSETLVGEIAKQGAFRIVVRRYCKWDPVDVAPIAKQIKQFWIEDRDAPNDLAVPFRWLTSLSIMNPPAAGFLSLFRELQDCSLDYLSELPPELSELPGLESLTLRDSCKLGPGTDFGALRGLKKLVLSGTSLPKNMSELGGLENLRFLGMSNWRGSDASIARPLQKLEECILGYFPKASALDGINAAKSLERLHLASWPKLEDVSKLSAFHRLKTLILEDCQSISSLSPLVDHPSLEEILLWGRTNIKDGKLRKLKRSPKLRLLTFNNRRHYDLKAEVRQCLANDRVVGAPGILSILR